MRFYYTGTRREHNAGLLALGNDVSINMVIPPNATNFTVAGLCTSKCTKKVKLLIMSIPKNFIIPVLNKEKNVYLIAFQLNHV